MLLQTNSYIVPKERRSEHARLMRRFRQVLGRLGCDDFEVYEQTAANWTGAAEGSQRFVQLMRFRDRKHHAALQAAERGDPAAQQLIAEFCEMVNFPYQQQHGFFAVGFYTSVLTPLNARGAAGHDGVTEELPPAEEAAAVEDVPVAAAADDGATPQETQAYEAEVLAESHEPGELASGGDEGGGFGDESPLIGDASYIPEDTIEAPPPPPSPPPSAEPVSQGVPEVAPEAEEASPAPAANRRRKKAKG
jgi:hypothetical protein